MPSSPARSTVVVPTRQESLRDLLAQVPDPRDPRGIRHPLAAILAVGIAAVVAGACSFTAIGEWAADAGGQVLAQLGMTGAAADEATFRRLFTRIDADVLDRLLGAWMWTVTTLTAGRRVIAIDGKSLRGATGSDGVMPHLVAAYDHAAGVVLGQVAVTAKSNEIPAVRDLLACFDLAGAVITVDAMHTQTDTARAILAGGGDYVFTCKKNQPGLHAQITKLPWTKVPAHKVTARTRGQRVTRTIKVIDAPDWIEFTGATQIAQVRRTVTRGGKRTVEVVYLITSADAHAAPPATLATWVQGHWGIDNRLHWVRDVTFDEDRSQVRTGHAPRVMATIRNTAISLLRMTDCENIAKALRHHARDATRPLNLLLTW